MNDEQQRFQEEQTRQTGPDPDDEDPGDLDDDEEAIVCPVCNRDVQEEGPCEHVVCAYERLEAPAPPGSMCRVGFPYSRLPQDEVERLCAALAACAASTAASAGEQARERLAQLPPLPREVVKMLRRREKRWGSEGTFSVSCDEMDLYLCERLHECPGYEGGDAMDGFESEQSTVATVMFHIHFAQDAQRAADQITEQMRQDAALLERLTAQIRESGQQSRQQQSGPLLASLPSRSDYFPPGAFDRNPRQNAFVVSWYGAALEAMEEPSLYLASREDPHLHAYRFLWLRTFHEPTAVRLTLTEDGAGTIVLKVTDGQGGYEPGDLEVHREEAVTPAEVADILDRWKRVGFWRLPTRSATGRAGLDGARWILEGVHEGRYHLVDRWSPGKRDQFREAALALVRLAKMPLDNVY